VANSALGHRLSHSSVGAPATGGTTMPEEHERSSFGSGIFCNKKICILKKHVVCLFGLFVIYNLSKDAPHQVLKTRLFPSNMLYRKETATATTPPLEKVHGWKPVKQGLAWK